VRLALAATVSINYGIYNGFELLEHEPIPGREEYLNSEKYELKSRDWDKPGNIKPYIAEINRIRRENAALQQTSGIRFLSVQDDQIIAYVKHFRIKPMPLLSKPSTRLSRSISSGSFSLGRDGFRNASLQNRARLVAFI
jgi:hypothetical protein